MPQALFRGWSGGTNGATPPKVFLALERLYLAGYPKDWGYRPRTPANALPPTGGTMHCTLHRRAAAPVPLPSFFRLPAVPFFPF